MQFLKILNWFEWNDIVNKSMTNRISTTNMSAQRGVTQGDKLCKSRGVKTFGELFNTERLTAVTTFCNSMKKILKKILKTKFLKRGI